MTRDENVTFVRRNQIAYSASYSDFAVRQSACHVIGSIRIGGYHSWKHRTVRVCVAIAVAISVGFVLLQTGDGETVGLCGKTTMDR